MQPVLRLILVLSVAAPFACAHTKDVEPHSKQFYAFDGADGKRALVLREVEGLIRVEDGRRRLLASLRLTAEAIEVEDIRGESRGRVPMSDDRTYRVVAAGELGAQFELSIEPDGDMSVEGTGGALLYQIKKRKYGYKVVDASGQVESRIRSRAGKVSVRDGTGTTFLSTRQPMSPAAVAALSLSQVPIEYAAALALAIQREMAGED